MIAKVYRFDDMLCMSQGKTEACTVKQIMVENVPGILNVFPAHSTNDKNGTDWWAEHASGKMLSIDAKVRSKDFGKKDVALETWSNVERKNPGWTVCESKRTDYVLWTWTDTGRWCLVPFPMLCAAFRVNMEDWVGRYRVARQFTPVGASGYHSECVFVPIREVWAAIYQAFAGMHAA